MFVLLYRVFTHVRMGILAMRICVYIGVFVEVCKYVILGILATSLCVFVCVVVDGMYTCKTGNFGKYTLCLC